MESRSDSPVSVSGSEPRVVFWYRVYCGAMVALYLLCLLAGIGLLLFQEELTSGEPEGDFGVMMSGSLLFVLGFLLAAAFLASFFLPRKRSSWIYHLVMICLGMTSVCTLPATIPLLIHWIKPETQDWFRLEGP